MNDTSHVCGSVESRTAVRKTTCFKHPARKFSEAWLCIEVLFLEMFFVGRLKVLKCSLSHTSSNRDSSAMLLN